MLGKQENTYRKIKLNHYLTPITKINAKCIKGLHLTPSTMKLVEDIAKKYLDIVIGNNFLDITRKAQTTKANINKWDCNKLKSFCTAKRQLSNTGCQIRVGIQNI